MCTHHSLRSLRLTLNAPTLHEQDASVGCFRRVSQPASLGDSLGNHFRITLRRCHPSAAAVHSRLLRCSNGQFINYFGVQRVGEVACVLQRCDATAAWACVDLSDLLHPPPFCSCLLSFLTTPRLLFLRQRSCGCVAIRQKLRVVYSDGRQPDAACRLVCGAARMVFLPLPTLQSLSYSLQQGRICRVRAGSQRAQRQLGASYAGLLRAR